MVEGLIEQGVAYCKNGDFAKGVELFDKALAVSPKDLVALSNRARALSRIDRLEDSLKDFEKLVDLQPANAQFVGDYAVALHLNNRDNDAAEAFDKALSLEPENPYRYSSRAFFKDRIGDHEGALADYDQCIAMDPEDAIALNNRGMVEEKLGYKERSKKSFDRSNKLMGYDPEAKAKKESDVQTASGIGEKSSNKFQAPKFEGDTPPTRWGVIKSVFTKEGFKDFVQFSKGLVQKKD